MRAKQKIFFLLFFISVLTGSCIDNSDGHEKRLVSKIDHILIEPENSYEFFSFLTDDLKLPVAWEYKNYENFMSGGVFCGNINLESISTDLVNTDSAICGIAFEPEFSTEETICELDHQFISHGFPVIMDSYVRTTINDILPDSWIFFCEYLIDKEKLKKSREIKQKELNKRDGGALGIEHVLEVTIKIKTETFIEKWKRLIPLNKSAEDIYIYSESSPNIHFIKSDKNEIESITFKVKSLEKARNFLAVNNMLGSESIDSISTDPENTYGVLFKFSENE